MNEKENNISNSKTKISKLAILVFILGISSMYIFLMREPLHYSSKYFERLLILKLISVIALVTGLLIVFTKKRFKGRGFAITGILTAGLSLLLGLSGIVPRPMPPSLGMICGGNLSSLGKSILIYANDYNGKYPTVDKWCDLLIIYSEVEPSLFICKGSDAKVGESSYALNANLAGRELTHFPPETVVLFETNSGKESSERDDVLENRYWYKILNTKEYSRDFRRIKKYKGSNRIYKDRWNQAGGQEILTIENHEDKGCFILFNDSHVEFIRTEEIGDLKWSYEENNE